jgi:hypothetical protein
MEEDVEDIVTQSVDTRRKGEQKEDNLIERMQRLGGGGMPACGSCPFPGTGYCDFYARGGKQRGGDCGCGKRMMMTGGGCGCGGPLFQSGGTRKRRGGYRPTKKNLKYLKKWRKGESIGFTMTSSLKAKGLIPRTSRKMKGKRVVSRKYR